SGNAELGKGRLENRLPRGAGGNSLCGAFSLKEFTAVLSQILQIISMKSYIYVALVATCALAVRSSETNSATETAPPVPRFSTNYMDLSVDPGKDFYHYADGTWLKNNPVPADKSRWASFMELSERNWYLIHQILEDAAADTKSAAKSPRREVGDFFASAMNTNRIEKLKFGPIEDDLKRVD